MKNLQKNNDEKKKLNKIIACNFPIKFKQKYFQPIYMGHRHAHNLNLKKLYI